MYMETTKILMQLIGVFLGVTGVSMLVHRRMMVNVFQELFRTRALAYVLGLVMLAAGLGLILNISLWGGVPQIVVAILAIDMMIESIMYLFLSKKTLTRMMAWIEKRWFYYLLTTIYTLFGVYFIYIGFFA